MDKFQVTKLLKLKDFINGFLKLLSGFKKGKLDEMSLQEKGNDYLDKINYLVHEINDPELTGRWIFFVENIDKPEGGDCLEKVYKRVIALLLTEMYLNSDENDPHYKSDLLKRVLE